MHKPDLVFLHDGKNDRVEHLIHPRVMEEIQRKRKEDEENIERMKQDVINSAEPVTTH
jgi:hypothetical protein